MDLHEHSHSAAEELDRRRHPRHTVNVQIEIRPEGTDVPFRLETTDLSRRGCYVQMIMPLQTGTRLDATLWLGGVSIYLRGVVATRHPGFGNGIMFVEFEGRSEELLNAYTDELVGK